MTTSAAGAWGGVPEAPPAAAGVFGDGLPAAYAYAHLLATAGVVGAGDGVIAAPVFLVDWNISRRAFAIASQ